MLTLMKTGLTIVGVGILIMAFGMGTNTYNLGVFIVFFGNTIGWFAMSRYVGQLEEELENDRNA